MKFKDKDAYEPFSVDFSGLLGDGVTILAGSFVHILPELDDGDTFTVGRPSYNDTVTTLWHGGGIEGNVYDVIHQVDASDGRAGLQLTQRIKIRER
jgi:hypothetical protein